MCYKIRVEKISHVLVLCDTCETNMWDLHPDKFAYLICRLKYQT